jgi:hypothetical protein
MTCADFGVLAGHPTLLSWRLPITGRQADPRELRCFMFTRPILDFGELQSPRRSSSCSWGAPLPSLM